MRIPKTKIWKAATPKNDSRPVLRGVNYNAKKGRLEACNGFIMALCPVSDESEAERKGGIVPAETVQEAYKMGRAQKKSPTLEQGPEGFTPGFVPAFPASDYKETGEGETRPSVEGQFPDCDVIMPNRHAPYEHVVTLDAKLLYDLAQAICEDDKNRSTPDKYHLRLYLDKSGASSVIVVRPGGYNLTKGNVGVMMPVSDPNAPEWRE